MPLSDWSIQRLAGDDCELPASPPLLQSPRRRTSRRLLSSATHKEDASAAEEEVLFRPQFAYGPKGHLICTPVCYALAYRFLRLGLSKGLTSAAIDGVMRACHHFFDDCELNHPLMLGELQRWFPCFTEPPPSSSVGYACVCACFIIIIIDP